MHTSLGSSESGLGSSDSGSYSAGRGSSDPGSYSAGHGSSDSGSFSAGSFSASQFTERTMLDDLLEQKGLLIGVGVALLGLFLFMRRSGGGSDEQQAARRLVRDWRKVDDADDARDLLGSNMPVILRPALLAILEVIEDQVEHGFRRLERQIQHL